MIANVILFQKLVQYHEETGKRAIPENQVRQMQKEIEEIQDIYTDMRGLRHDMRSHLANISSLVKGAAGSANEEPENYIGKMEKTVSKLDFAYQTGNPITDIIIHRKEQEAGNFSKDSIVALVDRSANVSKEELSYYFRHYNDGKAILDAIGFGENVSCGYNPAFKDYGVMRFDYNGSRQIIPNYAVPEMSAGSLPGIHAVNNSLVSDNRSYYAWTASNGNKYAWSVNNGMIGYVQSEKLSAEDNSRNYEAEMGKAGDILTALAQRRDLWEELYSRKEVLATCEKGGNVNLHCLWQRAVLPIIVVTTERKETTPSCLMKI